MLLYILLGFCKLSGSFPQDTNCVQKDPGCAWMGSSGCKSIHAYAGNHSVTITGKTCQRWDIQWPHEHSDNNPAEFPNSDIHHNHCRNPIANEGPWCYTTNPDVPWEYCFAACPSTSSGRCGVHANPKHSLSDYHKITKNQKFRARITGGVPSHPHGWPWLVNLNGCGGSIIRLSDDLEETDIVITAAHCFPHRISPKSSRPARKWVWAGDYNEKNKEDDEQYARIRNYTCANGDLCGKYSPDHQDFAVVKLDTPIKFQIGAQPICLPKPGQEAKVKQWCVITGWGITKDWPKPELTDVPHEAVVQVQDPIQCQKAYIDFFPEMEICAGIGKKSHCRGDSGGPLMCQFDGKNEWVLSGVITWADDCGQGQEESKKWGVYAKVTYFMEFMQREICKLSDYQNEISFCKKN